jgi:hypothetical protein
MIIIEFLLKFKYFIMKKSKSEYIFYFSYLLVSLAIIKQTGVVT